MIGNQSRNRSQLLRRKVDQRQFAEGVMARLGRQQVIKAAAYRAATPALSEASPPVGHPSFADLAVGATATCPLAVAFLDMTAMTARSFWEPLSTVTALSLAVLGQVAAVVQESGGYILGMRGDGLMAGWGDSESTASTDVYLALAACSFSLDSVEGVLNNTLKLSGIEPVQICAGADWGSVCFARTGTIDASEVNVVGHPANFAAKCEKAARSWEVVIGEGAAGHVANLSLLQAHEDSPKTYQHRGARRDYGFYRFAWRQIAGESASAISQVAGNPTSSVHYSF
jgi:class 3 adenylate cyclase